MTETQATSGTVETPTTAVEKDTAEAGAQANGRVAVGRATVPADAGSPKVTGAAAQGKASATEDEPSKEAASATIGAAAGSSAAAGATRPVIPNVPSVGTGPSVGSGPKQGSGVGSGPKQGTAAAGSAVAPNAPSVPPAAPGSGAPSAAGVAGVPRPGTAAGTGRPGAPAGRTPGMAGGAARVADAVRSARTTVTAAAVRGPRRARLTVKRIDPWSVMKFSLAVSVVMFIVVIVATAVLYLALDAMHVWASLNKSLPDLISAGGGGGSGDAAFRITAKGVIGTSALLGAVNVVLFTALATLAAFIYNVCADLVGGIEVTLAERE